MANTIEIGVEQLFLAAKDSVEPILHGRCRPVFEFTISPEFLAAFRAEKDRRAGGGVLIPTDDFAATAIGRDRDRRHRLLS